MGDAAEQIIESWIYYEDEYYDEWIEGFNILNPEC